MKFLNFSIFQTITIDPLYYSWKLIECTDVEPAHTEGPLNYATL